MNIIQGYLEDRYFLKDKAGNVVEDIDGMFDRVSLFTASAKDRNEQAKISKAMDYTSMLKQRLFCPNSPVLMNFGKPGSTGQGAACFALSAKTDSMIGIFDLIKDQSLIQQSGGGTGINWSILRPKGAPIRSSGGKSSGVMSFAYVSDAAMTKVEQAGARRGAGMGLLEIWHPEVIDFIKSKGDLSTEHQRIYDRIAGLTNDDNLLNILANALLETQFTCNNFSVGITDSFMQAVENDDTWVFMFPDTSHPDYDSEWDGDIVEWLSNSRPWINYGSIPARALFRLIVERAWKNGDPGIMFMDRLEEGNNDKHLARIRGVNPCGEQPLLFNEACNLGSINLAKFAFPDNEKDSMIIDWRNLKYIVRLAVDFLDDVIDVNKYPTKTIEENVKLTRKIGLGVAGFADLCVLMGVEYGSQKSLDLAEEVMEFIRKEAIQRSNELGEEYGSYPEARYCMRRNSTVTTIAPTGTIAKIMDCSEGIEPYFLLSYTRMIQDKPFKVTNKYLKILLEKTGIWSDELQAQIESAGSVQDIQAIPSNIRKLFKTSHEVSVEGHLRVQAAFQKHVCNAVSKTINMPNSASIGDVGWAFQLGWQLGLKGLTVYRDGSKMYQPLTTDKNKTQSHGIKPRPRPEITVGNTLKKPTGCGKMYLTINSDPTTKALVEVFLNTGSGGGCAIMTEAVSRLISMAMRSGISIDSIIDQLCSTHVCPSFSARRDKNLEGRSCPDIVGRCLRSMLNNLTIDQNIIHVIDETVNIDLIHKSDVCPECGSDLIHQSGCMQCKSCSYTKCD